MYKTRHPKSDVDRPYLPRTEGDRGLIQLEHSSKTTTIGPDKYLQGTQDTLPDFVKDHDYRKSLYSISRQSMKSSRELGVPAIPPVEDEANTTYARRTNAKPKHHGHQQLRPRVAIKSPPRQIPTAGETGWRWPRQDPQMAKTGWPQGRNRGLYHRSPR